MEVKECQKAFGYSRIATWSPITSFRRLAEFVSDKVPKGDAELEQCLTLAISRIRSTPVVT